MAAKCSAATWAARKIWRSSTARRADGRAKIMQRFANIPFKVTAGPHEVVVTFIERARALSDEYHRRLAARTAAIRRASGGCACAADSVASRSPVPSARPRCRRTPSRDKIFVCQPAERRRRTRLRRARSPSTWRAGPIRRPVNDADMAKLMPFFDCRPQGDRRFRRRRAGTGHGACCRARTSSIAPSRRAATADGAAAAQRPRAGLAPVVLPVERGPG